MSKEMEAFEQLEWVIEEIECQKKFRIVEKETILKPIKQALLELQAIKEAKPSEALEEIIDKFAEQMMRANKEENTATNKTNAIEYLYRTPQVRLLQQALLELQAIKEAKPSEALEEMFKTTYFGSKEEYDKINNCYNSIKQALIKTQQDNTALKLAVDFVNEVGKELHLTDMDEMLERIEKLEKVWKIVIEKNVDVNWFTTFKETEFYTYERYVSSHKTTKLTEEEFELIKEMLG